MASKDGLKDLLSLFDPLGFDARSPKDDTAANFGSSSLLDLDLFSPSSSAFPAAAAAVVAGGDAIPEKQSNLDLVAQIMPKISEEDVFAFQATSAKTANRQNKSTSSSSSKKLDPVASASSSCDFIKPTTKPDDTVDTTVSVKSPIFSRDELLQINGHGHSKIEEPIIEDVLSLADLRFDEKPSVQDSGPLLQSTESSSQRVKAETPLADLTNTANTTDLNLTSSILNSNFDEWLNQFESEPNVNKKSAEVSEVVAEIAAEVEDLSKNEPNLLENLDALLPPTEINGPTTATPLNAPRNVDKRLLDIWELFQAQSLAITKHHESASQVNGSASAVVNSAPVADNFSTPSSTAPTPVAGASNNVAIKNDQIETRDIKNNGVSNSIVYNHNAIASDAVKVVPSTNSSATPAAPPSSANSRLITCSTLAEDFEFEKRLPAGLFYVDTHCHLDLLFERLKFNESYESFKKIYAPTFSSLYRGCITDFCFPSNFLSSSSLFDSFLQNEDVRAAVGCHPHQADLYTDDVEQFIMQTLSNEKTVAFGECGLDYSSKNNVNPNHQQAVFKRQLRVAKCFYKPLVIHCRNADPDCFSIMKEVLPHDYPIHLHCFTGSYEASNLWSNYFTRLYFGITPGICMQRYRHQIEFVKRVPLNRIVIESDSPYFLPEKYAAHELRRDGLQYNHPGLGSLVAQKIAEVRQVPAEDVLSQIFRNTQALYDAFY